MQLGAMNHPMRDVVEQIAAFREAGFDFLDLTLEPEKARASDLDVRKVRHALAEAGLGVVGHTAWYLPLASPFPEIREAAVRELWRDLEVFAALGVSRVNVHPDSRVTSLYNRDWTVARNVESLGMMVERAGELGLTVMLENLPGVFNRTDVLQKVFEAVPALGFHLDVGHANLLVEKNVSDELLAAFASRLLHVHFSDNNGGDRDLHLPLGAGLIDWRWAVKMLKKRGYDGTITLEVFSADPDYLALSGRKLRRLWAEVG